MPGKSESYAVLIEATNAIEAELAKNLLESEGIPCLLHGQDRDLAELGPQVHANVAGPSILVPHAALARARAVLAAAWGSERAGGTVQDDEPNDDPNHEAGA